MRHLSYCVAVVLLGQTAKALQKAYYNNVENEILSIINAVNNKNRNALINVRESIYSSNSYIRKVLSDLRMQDVRPIGLVRTREQMVKSIFHCQQMLHRPLDTSQMNSLLAHLSEFTPLQLKDQNTQAHTYNADILMHRNTPNLPLYKVDTHKHPEVKSNFPPVRVGTENLRQVNSQLLANKISTTSYFRTNPYNVGTHKRINENSHFPSIMAGTFQPVQINLYSPYNLGTHRPSPVYPCHTPVTTEIATTKGSNAHNLHKQNNISYNTHMDGRYASTTPTAHTYQTQHSTEYCNEHQCASHTPDYQPISKLL